MSDLRCKSCGADTYAPGTPNEFTAPEHCRACPPWICADCGELDSVGGPNCRCWQSLEGMPLADLKAIFAGMGLSLTKSPQADRP